MRTAGAYNYALSLTSQFYFCELPLRLDSYSSCLYACQYCFAAARGGKRPAKGIKLGDPLSLERLLADPKAVGTVIGEFIAHRQPVHFGGMSDPFPTVEADVGVSLRYLEVLKQHQYPTVISTKGTMVASPPYLELLRDGNFLVQLSFSSADSALARKIELGVPSPTSRLEAMERLAEAGVKTACRIQPLLPERAQDGIRLLELSSSAGAVHAAVEHLKVPVEDYRGIRRLGDAVSVDVPRYYASHGARRIGREWILPVEMRLPTVLEFRDRAHALGLSFGAADTDLLPLSDHKCCCSGADALLVQAAPFEHNYLGAVRRADKRGVITYDSLRGCWAPSGSIARMVNSRSRLQRSDGSPARVTDYIRANWNGRMNGASPKLFYGVEATGKVDFDGLLTYRMSDQLRQLIGTTHEGRQRHARSLAHKSGHPTRLREDGEHACKQPATGRLDA